MSDDSAYPTGLECFELINQSASSPSANAPNGNRKVQYDRADNDWYVEPSWCVEQLANAIYFTGDVILDPCAGAGTIPDVFAKRGNTVWAHDLVDRGYPGCVIGDFLTTRIEQPKGRRLSIVLNPPFNQAAEFARRAISIATGRVALLQQLSFLASKARHELFTEFPPSDVLILSKRPSMPPGHMIAEMGDKAFRGGTKDFCWIVWTAPHDRETRMRWLPPIFEQAS
jgi:hypothetical protein